MADPAGRTLVCSVLFTDCVGYSKKGVGEQVPELTDGVWIALRECGRLPRKLISPV